MGNKFRKLSLRTLNKDADTVEQKTEGKYSRTQVDEMSLSVPGHVTDVKSHDQGEVLPPHASKEGDDSYPKVVSSGTILGSTSKDEQSVSANTELVENCGSEMSDTQETKSSEGANIITCDNDDSTSKGEITNQGDATDEGEIIKNTISSEINGGNQDNIKNQNQSVIEDPVPSNVSSEHVYGNSLDTVTNDNPQGELDDVDDKTDGSGSNSDEDDQVFCCLPIVRKSMS